MSDRTALALGESFFLPIEAVTEKLAFLGRTGSGKTFGATKLAEQMLYRGAQVIALDPVGKWWSLRLDANGEDPGIDIPVFGGLHGDVPLEPTAGALIADLIVDRGISAVIDVSQFESEAAKARFATDFGNRLFFRKKAAPSALHLFLEEAQEFVPQNAQSEEARMLHAYTRIWKLGRNYGIGGSLLSQRPQEVNKKVLNLTELLFAFQMTGPHERKTVQGWIAEKGIDEDIAGDLPKLEIGAPHVWSPAWLKVSKVVRIGKRSTFDASSTPRVGDRAVERPLAPIDLVKIRGAMAAAIERAAAEDPKKLRARIAQLEREVAAAAKAAAPIVPISPPAISQLMAADWAQQIDRLRGRLTSETVELQKLVTFMLAESQKPSSPPPRTFSLNENHGHPRTLRRDLAKVSYKRAPDTTSDLGRPHRAILAALAATRAGLTREQLGVRTLYRSDAGHFGNVISDLRQSGFVEGSPRLQITETGYKALGDYNPLPIGDALVAAWRGKLGKPQSAILEALVLAYPNGLTRAELGAATNYRADAGHFGNCISTIRSLGLAAGSPRLVASEELF